MSPTFTQKEEELRKEWEETALYKFHPATQRAWEVYTRDPIANWWLDKIKLSLEAQREELAEEIGETHNLSTDYQNTDCGFTDHTPMWDGNYYTCNFCGEEFIKKSSCLSIILGKDHE